MQGSEVGSDVYEEEGVRRKAASDLCFPWKDGDEQGSVSEAEMTASGIISRHEEQQKEMMRLCLIG